MKARQKAGYTYKKRMSAYQEINKTKREGFQTNVNKILLKKFVCIDKIPVNNESKDGYDDSPRGERCFSKRKARVANNNRWGSKGTEKSEHNGRNINKKSLNG